MATNNNYLVDKEGLEYFLSKLRIHDLAGKVDKVEGKGLSENDYTDADKLKLADIDPQANYYVHPQYTPRAIGLYRIQVDASGHVAAVSPVTKADIVALGIPGQDTTYQRATQASDGLMSSLDKTKLDGFDAADKYAKKSEIGTVMRYKGSVATFADLPQDPEVGDFYDVREDGSNYAWDGQAWDPVGSSLTIEVVTTQDIDEMFA